MFQASAVGLRSAKHPGALRAENMPLDPKTPLSAQMPLLSSRDPTYKCLVSCIARIFKRWTRRAYSNDTDEFHRGLAHLLILSCAGSGMCLQPV